MSDTTSASINDTARSMLMELPTEIAPATRIAPENVILFGLPKCGKTTEIAKLPNCLIIDAERGSNYVACMRMQPKEGLGPVAVFKWIKEVAAAIRAAGRPYDYVAVETISYLDELSEWVGTRNFMNSVQGKTFNRYPALGDDHKPHPKAGQMIKFGDVDYQSVHDMGKGYGYRWSRQAMTDILGELKGLGRIATILTCHTAEKQIISKLTNTEVNAIDLSLTGKVRQIFSRDVDAIGYVYNKDGVLNVSFKGNEDKVGGMRGATHLQGYNGPLDWEMIFNPKVA